VPFTTVDRYNPRSPRAVGSYVSVVLLTLLFGTACTSRAAGTATSPASSGTGTSAPMSASSSPMTGISLPAGPTVATASAIPSAVASTPVPTRTAGAGNELIVTQADQGKSFQVSVGAIIEFDLRADGPTGTTVESAHTSDTKILQKLSGSAGPGPTGSAICRAIGPGTAFVIALMTLPCRTAPATPCALAQEGYGFHVQVMPSK
jgi:hypothetical protein